MLSRFQQSPIVLANLLEHRCANALAATRTGFRYIDIDKAIEVIRTGRQRRRRLPTTQTATGSQMSLTFDGVAQTDE
jgi:hypothetical protein